MCGFFGSLSNRQRINRETFQEIIDQISHRGPDDKGFYEDEEIFVKNLAKITIRL